MGGRVQLEDILNNIFVHAFINADPSHKRINVTAPDRRFKGRVHFLVHDCFQLCADMIDKIVGGLFQPGHLRKNTGIIIHHCFQVIYIRL